MGRGRAPKAEAIHIDLLERVGRGRLAAGKARGALDVAERGLAIDGLNEGLWRLALEAESALGLREAVAERYERLRVLLDERLGLSQLGRRGSCTGACSLSGSRARCGAGSARPQLEDPHVDVREGE
jgi:hypothetical protein